MRSWLACHMTQCTPGNSEGRTGAELEALAASGYLDSMKATEH